MKVYFISGLAADEKVFRHLSLPPGLQMIHLAWIPPQLQESLQSYALRLAEQVDTNGPFCLVGLSFGGMIASEIARSYRPAETILISSIPSPDHLPFYFRLAGKAGLHKIIPVSWIKSAALLKRLFTRETPGDKRMLRRMVLDSNRDFIRWAMNAVITWDSRQPLHHYFQLHGSRDEILPLRFTRPNIVLHGAGHMMVLDRAEELNAILVERLEGYGNDQHVKADS